MEPKQYMRLLRRRWVFLLLLAMLGASIGYASTLLTEDDPGPVVTYWSASEVLVVDAGTEIDLQRLSVFATNGIVPQRVAESRGIAEEELRATIRTVSDRSDGTLTISAVATSAEDARDIAADITAVLLEELNAENVEAYAGLLEEARAEVEEQLAATAALDFQIGALLEKRDEGTVTEDPTDGLSSAEEDQLRTLQVQRDTAIVRYGEAERVVDELETNGPAPIGLSQLDSVLPFRISAKEYDAWVTRGRQGETNFVAGEVDLADTSSPTVSERLENPAARAVLGALAGLILGIVLVLIHARLDPRLRTREKTEAAFGLPVLTEIPVISRRERKHNVLHAHDKPRSAVSEAYRYLRSVLLFARSGVDKDRDALTPEHNTGHEAQDRLNREVRVLMITSAGEGEGKTTTAVNLAVLMAEAGYKTLLINCDFRLPNAHTVLGVPYEPGRSLKTIIPNLRFVGDVQRREGDTPGEVAERQRRLIRRARNIFDVVVLDTAPVLATNDAIDLLPETDLAVLVAREARTTEDAAAEARELLIDRMGVPVAGVVVTAAGQGLGTGYYDRYRYGSYFDGQAATLWAVLKAKFKTTPKDGPSRLAPEHLAEQDEAGAADAEVPAPPAPEPVVEEAEAPAPPAPEPVVKAAEDPAPPPVEELPPPPPASGPPERKSLGTRPDVVSPPADTDRHPDDSPRVSSGPRHSVSGAPSRGWAPAGADATDVEREVDELFTSSQTSANGHHHDHEDDYVIDLRDTTAELPD